MEKLIGLWRDESGTSAIEYGFIVALIVIGIIGTIQTIGNNFVVGPLTTVNTSMSR